MKKRRGCIRHRIHASQKSRKICWASSTVGWFYSMGGLWNRGVAGVENAIRWRKPIRLQHNSHRKKCTKWWWWWGVNRTWLGD